MTEVGAGEGAKIMLQSADGDSIAVDRDVVFMSATLKNMLEDLGDDADGIGAFRRRSVNRERKPVPVQGPAGVAAHVHAADFHGGCPVLVQGQLHDHAAVLAVPVAGNPVFRQGGDHHAAKGQGQEN